MIKNNIFNIDDFLEDCKISTNNAYNNFKKLLHFLENPATQSEARIFFKMLENQLDTTHVEKDPMQIYHFSIDKLSIDSHDAPSGSLTLLQLPSIFTPENWSFTFFEGLLRYSNDEFFARSIAELGCGNGWISIALAQRTFPYMMYGLDINPRAIVCAKINLYLNALNDKGKLKYDSQGKSLLDRVQFHVSDLLGHCMDNKIFLDKVIGCIPQVLAPNANMLDRIITENMDDEILYDLSNYCTKQGYIEDQFGLGLNARAIEESIQTLKPNGKIILNLGGRPGQTVLKRLFTRRGLTTQTIWKTKIEQAADTEILPLVDIEKKSSHRFEFFMSQHTKESISARTAYAFGQNGGKIFHSLNVMEAELKDSVKLKKILKLLKHENYSEAKSSLDLSYDTSSLTTEKISFLARLSDKIISSECFPYENVRGETSFRRRIAEYFRAYWKCNFTAKNVIVAPNRIEFIKNTMTIFEIKKALIDSCLCRQLPSEMLQTDPLASDCISIIEIPKNCNSICDLIQKLKPQFVVCSLQDSEMQNQDSIRRLFEVTNSTNSLLFFDFSDQFELSSSIKTNGMMELLTENHLPSHVALICGLIHNRIYQDMDIAYLISESKILLNYLSNAAELTYSRAPLITQDYYDTILFDLLNFQIKNLKKEIFLLSDKSMLLGEKELNLPLSKTTQEAFSDPALESTSFNVTQNTIRLDYGENSLPSPTVLKSILMESYARQNILESEIQAEQQISKYLNKKYGESFEWENIVIGNGIAPLFWNISKYCAKNNISIIFPTGAYGYFIAASKFAGVNIIRIETKEELAFKYDLNDLENFLKEHRQKNFFLFLNAPVVNPIGQIYTPEEVKNICNLCYTYNTSVIIDTIFSGLEFEEHNHLYNHINAKDNLILLGGLSKEFSAAGLRIGYAHTSSKTLLKYLQKENIHLHPKTHKYVIDRIYSLINKKDERLLVHLNMQKKILKQRAEKLSTTLKESGWSPISCQGGLFLIAKPTELIGQKIKFSNTDLEIIVTPNNVHEVLFKATGLLINSALWCGIPNYCRFVLSVSDKEFMMACERVKQFYKMAGLE